MHKIVFDLTRFENSSEIRSAAHVVEGSGDNR